MSWELEDLTRHEHIVSEAYRNGAKNQRCTAMTSWCNHDPSTVVLAHADWQSAGKGTGLKAHDLFGADMCDGCHRWFHHAKVPLDVKRPLFYLAMEKTQLRRIQQGLLVVRGHKTKLGKTRG